MNRRQPPHDLAAEEALIGAAILRPALLGEAIHTVDPGDFYKPSHQSVWATMLEMHEHGQPIDAVTVAGCSAAATADELQALAGTTPSISAWGMYADIVINTSRQRRLIALCADIADGAYDGLDVDELISRLDARGDRLIAPRSPNIDDLYVVEDFVAMVDDDNRLDPWVIPGLMRPRWRIVIVAEEGIGKGTMMRQMAVMAAAGVHPFNQESMPPVRCLYADFENPSDTIRHQVGIVSRSAKEMIRDAGDRLMLFHREAGVDLRSRRHLAEFEAVIQRAKPDAVFMGPLYKAFRRGRGEDMEQATIEFVEILDDLRTRYNFALMLEHHAPKQQGPRRDREMNPFGSSVLLRWPEMGLTLEALGDGDLKADRIDCKVGRFRRDRVVAAWPDEVIRGASMAPVAWQGRWHHSPGF